jgi:hypothetical protein
MAGLAFKPADRRTNKGEENLPLLFWFVEKHSALSRQHSAKNIFTAKGAKVAKKNKGGATL